MKNALGNINRIMEHDLDNLTSVAEVSQTLLSQMKLSSSKCKENANKFELEIKETEVHLCMYNSNILKFLKAEYKIGDLEMKGPEPSSADCKLPSSCLKLKQFYLKSSLKSPSETSQQSKRAAGKILSSPTPKETNCGKNAEKLKSLIARINGAEKTSEQIIKKTEQNNAAVTTDI